MHFRLLQSQNAYLLIVFTLSPIVTAFNPVHELNADDSIDVTESGIVILFNELHNLNA